METEDSLILSVKEGYNRWSEFYDRDDIPLHILEEPIVDKALGDVAGLTILDLGCGTGRQTLRLAERGALVTGIDQSEGMLENAREKDRGGKCRFLYADLENAFPVPTHSFDRVVSFLALEHLSDLKKLFAECRRVCKRDGWLFFTVMHPAMTLRGVQARYTEEATGRKVYPKSFPYQISDYLNAAIDTGLKLQQISEHSTNQSHAAVSERALKYEGWPLLLTLKFWP